MTQVDGLVVADLHLDDHWIDPTRTALRQRLVAQLGLEADARVERLQGKHGGLNMGVWSIQDSSRHLVLKLVTSTRFMGLPSEAERLLHLARTRPELVNDRDLAFPAGIFLVVASDQTTRSLIAMDKVAGESFADIIAGKLKPGRSQDIKGDMQKFGAFLAAFHSRYGLQHGDCQLGNVFLDAASGRFSLIDVSDMGSPMLKDGDVQHFSTSLRGLAGKHGRQLVEDCLASFQKGYADAANSEASPSSASS